MRVRHILVSLAALCVIGATAPAAFASYQDVIRECYNTGSLPAGKYSRHELLQARNHLPSDIREYSDCEDLINSALAAGKKSSGGGGGGAGAVPTPAPNPALTTPSGATAGSQDDLNALSSAQKQSAPPQVKIADSKLSPSTGGVLRAAKNTDVNSLPTPLLASLIALAAMALLGGTSVLRQHWPRIRRAPLRLFRR